MTTPQPNQLPEEVKPPYKISEREPVFPCWLWGYINIIYPSPVEHWRKHSDMPNAGLHYLPGSPADKLRPGVFLATHWAPDQPTVPTDTPYLAPRPPAPRDVICHICGKPLNQEGSWFCSAVHAPRDAEWAKAFDPMTGPATAELANAFLRWPLPETVRVDACCLDVKAKNRTGTNLLSVVEALQLMQQVVCPIILRHAPADSASAQLAAPQQGETPRTDAACFIVNGTHVSRTDGHLVPADFARALERELAALIEQRDIDEEMLASHESTFATLRRERDELRVTLEAELQANAGNEQVVATLRQELEEKCAENDRAWSAHLQAYGAAMKECAAWQAKFTDLNKSLMAELRDPSGTIWEHAEALQKERDELQAKLDDNSAAGIHSCSDKCQRIECVQRREIAELRAKLAKLSA